MAQSVKILRAMQETGVRYLIRKVPWRRKWQPIPVFLLGKSHGQTSLVGYNPWGHKSWTRLRDSLGRASKVPQNTVFENWEDFGKMGRGLKFATILNSRN